MKTDYRKIDIFTAHTYNGKRYFAYSCSTTWAPTCKAAVVRFIETHALAYPSLKDVKARFSSKV